MKTSNRILLITFCSIAVFILIGAIVTRIFWGPVFIEGNPGKRVTRTIEARDFSGITVSSSWQMNITHGDTFSVKITVPENVESALVVEKHGSMLEFGQKRTLVSGAHSRIRADVVMPTLTRLDFSGVAEIKLNGFSVENLEVDSSGVGSVKATNFSVENLFINLSGMGSVDFSNAAVKNADINLSGVGSLKVHMNGGILRGSLSGVGSLEYSGVVSSQEVEKSGLGTVQRK